jgi:hypothetical protein
MERRQFMVSLGGLLAGLCGNSKAAGMADREKSEFILPEMATFLPEEKAEDLRPFPPDWLVTPPTQATQVRRSNRPNEIILTNGLIRRCWRLRPNAATVGFDNLMTGASMLRGVKPEAYVELHGQEFPVGGLHGQPDYAYLTQEWIDRLEADPKDLRCTGFKIGKMTGRFPWKKTRFSGNQPWPPPGASLSFRFEAKGPALSGVEVFVHYEMFDGIPLLSKWLSIHNTSGEAIRLNHFVNEVLAVVEYASAVNSGRWEYPNIHVESDYEFGGEITAGTCNQTVHWLPDPEYTSQVNYDLKTPCLLKVYPPLGPDIDVLPGETFTSYRTYELVYDTTERERQGLALRRMYRTIAPWVTENPIFMHVTNSQPIQVKAAIDQAAEAGFEMVIISFGSGFNPEGEDPGYIQGTKNLVDYAKQKGITLGCYSLLASRDISPEDDVVNPKTGTTEGAIFGHSPCLGSRWGTEYFRKLRAFLEETGMGALEHDGSYPGDVCASTRHPGHRGLSDSQWTQWKEITDFYQWCRARGIYLNVPDWYFLNASNKTGMGYRETDWSLPRAEQVILGRQNIFDGTWEKTPSMGWMLVPLVQYQGGGAAATIEPLHEHLDVYGQILAQNLGSGVQAAYRGPRLYDSEETEEIVKKWVDFYKAHRDILESDIIHLRRADGRDLDAILHVNPQLATKGFAIIYNPIDAPVTRTLTLPLYYTGLVEKANIRERDGAAHEYQLNRKYEVEVVVSLPARGLTWLTIG